MIEIQKSTQNLTADINIAWRYFSKAKYVINIVILVTSVLIASIVNQLDFVDIYHVNIVLYFFTFYSIFCLITLNQRKNEFFTNKKECFSVEEVVVIVFTAEYVSYAGNTTNKVYKYSDVFKAYLFKNVILIIPDGSLYNSITISKSDVQEETFDKIKDILPSNQIIKYNK